MGTNYYAAAKPCPTCGKPERRIHIGKASHGWCFALCYNVAMNLISLESWLKFLRTDVRIEDEHGVFYTVEEMQAIIDDRGCDSPLAEYAEDHSYIVDFHARNNSEPGPKNLFRHKIGYGGCVGHGEGTWDYIQGEFT